MRVLFGQKDTKETFLECFLNSCQEWFLERDRLLRSASVSSQRWSAFINFLSEMYLKVVQANQSQGVGNSVLGCTRN